ncbi:MAG: hypothetical protein HN348_25205, partial [Proteobacteria bacterium]|nr:hypothetical protein [Pseudomonadota bacterium]
MYTLLLALFALCDSALASDDVELAIAELSRRAVDNGELSFEGRSLRWAGGSRVRLSQILHGLPIEEGDLVVALDPNGEVAQVYGELQAPLSIDTSPSVPANRAIEIAHEALIGAGEGELWPPRANLVVFHGSLAWAVDVGKRFPLRTWRVLVDAHNGDLLRSKVTSASAMGQVSPANPSNSKVTQVQLPRLTAPDTLTGENADVFSCDDWEIDDGIFGVSLCHNTTRYATPDTGGDYLFSPQPEALEDPFAEVQAYYHIDLIADWVGYNFGVNHGPMRVHVNFGMQNAFYGDFDGDGEPDISLGQSEDGVDFGYDADVIYH